MEPIIIFEDKDILVLEKPAGLVVNRAKSVKGKTIQEWLEKHFGLKPGEGIGNRAGIVHRLDKETSGLLLVAKTPQAFENLQKQFKERRVEKRYKALVHGEVKPKKGEISAPVGRLPWSREKFGVFLGGRPAKTEYEVKNYYTLDAKPYFERSEKQGSSTKVGGSYTLLELTPKTGRTHQIRVHLKYLRHPIVSDPAYAGRKTSREDRKWCPRIFLHASYLEFFHPKTGKNIKFASKLPENLKKALGVLEKS